MDIAIVTGAETALGLRIAQTLVQQGCRVHAIGNNFSKVTYADPQFKGHAVDLTDTAAVAALLERIIDEEKRLDVLVHAIDVTPGAAFEKLSPGNLEAVLKIGLLDPILLTRLALPNLLRFRGQLIHVLTSNKNGHAPSAVNALIEGGLRDMNRALFDQSRDAGLRLTNCILRQNTSLPGGQISDTALEQTHIDLDDVARVIEQLIDPKAVNVPAEVVLYPRLSAGAAQALPEAPLALDPYSVVSLPPKAYCPPPEEKIPTAQKQQIERTIPYTDEEMEDRIAAAIEEYEAHPERYDFQEPMAPRAPRSEAPLAAAAPGAAPTGEAGRSKRRRRRGGRNRNKSKPDADGSSPVAPRVAEDRPQPERAPSNDADGGSRRSKRRSGRNRERPERERSGEPRDAGSGAPESRREPRPEQPRPAPIEAPKAAPASTAPAPKATEVAKPAKKAAAKTAAKKTPAKKAAKKAPAKKAAKKKAAKKAVAPEA